MDLFTKQTHGHKTQTYDYKTGSGGRDKLGVWIRRYKLVYVCRGA